jgi:hypothetical protein
MLPPSGLPVMPLTRHRARRRPFSVTLHTIANGVAVVDRLASIATSAPRVRYYARHSAIAALMGTPMHGSMDLRRAGLAPVRRWRGVAVAGLLALLASLGGCAARQAPDAAVPPFARQPYEPFDRAAAVAIARREWRLFDRPVRDAASPQPAIEKPERAPGLWQRVGEYWWLGLGGDDWQRRWTGEHDEHGRLFPPDKDGDYAWSAAFISYVMRMAGAGARFPYSSSHSDYINAARKASLAPIAGAGLWAERPDLYAPQAGDLICQGRGSARKLRFEDLPAGHFPSHCDIVVDVMPGEIAVIGGNVDDTVAMKHVPTTGEGRLAGPDRVVLDGRYPWFVVIRVLYDR